MTCASRSNRMQRWLLPAAALALFLFAKPNHAVAAPLPQSPIYTVTYAYGEVLWFEIAGQPPTNSVEAKLTIQASTGTHADIRTVPVSGLGVSTNSRIEVSVAELMLAPAELITYRWTFHSSDGTTIMGSDHHTVWYEDQDVPWVWVDTVIDNVTIRYPNDTSIETVSDISETVRNTLAELPAETNNGVRLYLYPDLVTLIRALSLHQAEVNGWYTTSHFPGTPVSFALLPGDEAGLVRDIPYAITRTALQGIGLDRWLIEGASLSAAAEDPTLAAVLSSTSGNAPDIDTLCAWMPALHGSPPVYYAASLSLYSLLAEQTGRDVLADALPYTETECHVTIEGISGLSIETEQIELDKAQSHTSPQPLDESGLVATILIILSASILITSLFIAPQQKTEDYDKPPENTIRTRQVIHDE